MKLKPPFRILMIVVTAWSVYGQAANEVDPDLYNALNSQANHDIQRRKQFKEDRNGKKVFSDEREKGLSQFLEEQEKWDLLRERGLIEHRKQAKVQSPVEGGPEYLLDEKQKAQAEQKREQARKQTVQTRRQVAEKLSPQLLAQESEELDLKTDRPRYDLRKRGSNKWVKGNGSSRPGFGGPSGGGGGYSAPPPAFDDFPPQPDYMPAPAPMDGFEEIPPPPPPPVNYDGSGVGGFPGVDGGFGEAPPPPPPPALDDFD